MSSVDDLAAVATMRTRESSSVVTESTDDYVAALAFEILREWMDEPEPADLMPQAERVKAADAARKDTA